jgi:hypothetical protein
MYRSSQDAAQTGEVYTVRCDILSVRFARSWKPVLPLGIAARNLKPSRVTQFSLRSRRQSAQLRQMPTGGTSHYTPGTVEVMMVQRPATDTELP